MKKTLLYVIAAALMLAGFTACAGVEEEDPFAGEINQVEATPQYIIDYNKGFSFASKKDWNNAIPYYENTLNLLDKLSEEKLGEDAIQRIHRNSLLGLGLAYGNLGDNSKAGIYFNKFITRWPHEIDGYLTFGAILEKNGDSEKAHELYTKAMNVNPQSAVAEFALANIYRQDGRLDDAISYYRKGLKKDPGFQEGNGWFQLGKTYEEKGDYQGMITSYEEMSKVRPDDWQAYFFLADAYLTKGMKTGSDKARITKADIDERIGYYKQAIETDKMGLNIKVDSAQLMSHLATSYVRLAEMYKKTNTTMFNKYANDAIEVLTRFTKSYPDNEKGYALLADGYQKLHNYNKAIEAADKSLQIADNDYAHSILGDVYFTLERWNASQSHYLKIAQNPQYPYVRGRLEIIAKRLRGEYD